MLEIQTPGKLVKQPPVQQTELKMGKKQATKSYITYQSASTTGKSTVYLLPSLNASSTWNIIKRKHSYLMDKTQHVMNKPLKQYSLHLFRSIHYFQQTLINKTQLTSKCLYPTCIGMAPPAQLPSAVYSRNLDSEDMRQICLNQFSIVREFTCRQAIQKLALDHVSSCADYRSPKLLTVRGYQSHNNVGLLLTSVPQKQQRCGKSCVHQDTKSLAVRRPNCSYITAKCALIIETTAMSI